MITIKIREVKVRKQGSGYYFLIPAQYIRNGVLDLNTLYDIEVKRYAADTNSNN